MLDQKAHQSWVRKPRETFLWSVWLNWIENGNEWEDLQPINGLVHTLCPFSFLPTIAKNVEWCRFGVDVINWKADRDNNLFTFCAIQAGSLPANGQAQKCCNISHTQCQVQLQSVENSTRWFVNYYSTCIINTERASLRRRSCGK